MVTDSENGSDKKSFRFSDLALTCGFVLLGIFLIYVVIFLLGILLLGIWEFPTLPRQFIGP